MNKKNSNKNKNEECPLCDVSEETLSRLEKSRKSKLYQCPECGFWYKEKKWAQKCEQWCRKHKSCNIEITKHAIKRSN